MMEGRIGDHVRSLRLENISEERVFRAKRTFFDALAAGLAGARTEQVRQTARALGIRLEEDGGASGPVVWGWGRLRASLSDTVYLNGVAAHSCEYNDLFYGMPGHPSAVLAPVALGLGEQLSKSGKEVLEAYLCGMEVMGRINDALIPEHHLRGFHSTATAGIIGAAMTAGKLLELPPEELEAACSLACTFACGLRRNLGYTGNSLHVGNAAAGGLKAALFSRAGIRGRLGLLTLPDGYLSAFGGSLEKLEQSLDRLGRVSVFEEPGILIKRFPVCYSAYQAIEAAQELLGMDLELNQIREIGCRTSPNHYMSLPMEWPDTAYGQRFCVPFCVCMTLLEGGVENERLSEPLFREPELLRLRERFSYGVEEGQRGRADFGSTLLWIRLQDGRRLESRKFPSCGERVENWEEERLKKKWTACCRPILGEAGADAFWRDSKNFEQIEDVADWTRRTLAPKERRAGLKRQID